jgi:DNA-binding CsgD family transcriptional regulator
MTALQPILISDRISDRGFDEAQHPWIRALETFAIPFFTYAGDGYRVCTSPAAESLVDLLPAGSLLMSQADAAMSAELGESQPIRLHPFALAREVTSCVEGLVLAVHVATLPVGGICGIVIVRAPTPATARHDPLLGLTVRQTEVARLIATGLQTKAIARRLGISTHTTRHHTERVFAKLRVKNRSSLAALLAGNTYVARALS